MSKLTPPTKDQVLRLANKLKERTCRYCDRTYILGANGVDTGCDDCEGIVRNPAGMIIYDPIQFQEKDGDQ